MEKRKLYVTLEEGSQKKVKLMRSEDIGISYCSLLEKSQGKFKLNKNKEFRIQAKVEKDGLFVNLEEDDEDFVEVMEEVVELKVSTVEDTLENPHEESPSPHHHLQSSSTVDVHELSKKLDLKAVLECHPKGKDIVEEYNIRKALTPQTRISLINILCAELVKQHGYYPSLKEKTSAAKSIIEVFPLLQDESGKTGFEHFFTAEGGQSGYIQSRLKNIRRHLSTDDKQRPRCKTKIDQSTDKQIGLRIADLPTVEEDEAKRLSTFCRSAPVESKDAILSAMKKSTGNRMSWIKQDGPSVTEILKEYPQYIEIPELITQDFEQMFGTDIGHNFLLKWGQHASKVLAYISSSKNPTLVDLKDEYQATSKSEELSALYGLRGLIHLLPSFNTRKKGKCSREEVIQFFLDNQPIGTSVEDYTNKASAEGIIRRQPYLLGIGNAHELQQFFIIVDRRAIPTSRQSCNIVAATDVLFKFYYIFNLDYPPQLENFFIYLQTEIYNIPVHPGQKLANRVKEIKVALQNVWLRN